MDVSGIVLYHVLFVYDRSGNKPQNLLFQKRTLTSPFNFNTKPRLDFRHFTQQMTPQKYTVH